MKYKIFDFILPFQGIFHYEYPGCEGIWAKACEQVGAIGDNEPIRFYCIAEQGIWEGCCLYSFSNRKALRNE